jgi:hypothetical protein
VQDLLGHLGLLEPQHHPRDPLHGASVSTHRTGRSGKRRERRGPPGRDRTSGA